jgi:hypothetical protein
MLPGCDGPQKKRKKKKEKEKRGIRRIAEPQADATG